MKAVYVFTVLLLTAIVFPAAGQRGPSLEDDGLVYMDRVPYTGTYKMYEQGILSSEMEMHRGIRHGKVVNYFTDQSVRETGAYINGNKHGPWKMYDEHGFLVAEAHYINGKKDGVWKVWDHSGRLRSHTNYTNDQKTGVWKVWNAKGELVQKKTYPLSQ